MDSKSMDEFRKMGTAKVNLRSQTCLKAMKDAVIKWQHYLSHYGYLVISKYCTHFLMVNNKLPMLIMCHKSDHKHLKINRLHCVLLLYRMAPKLCFMAIS